MQSHKQLNVILRRNRAQNKSSKRVIPCDNILFQFVDNKLKEFNLSPFVIDFESFQNN